VVPYLIRYRNRRYKSAMITLMITFPLVSIVLYSKLEYEDNGIRTLMIILIIIGLFTISLIKYSISLFIKDLKKITKSSIILNNTSIIQDLLEIKEFSYSEISVIHKRKFGLMILRGRFLRKIDYLRPKRSPAGILDSNVIFIPSIINNYDDIVYHLVQNCNNAMKIGI